MPDVTAPKSVLIAGGAGYIGSHTAKVLSRAGMIPVVLDNLCAGNRESVRYGPFFEGSTADPVLVSRIIKEYRPAGAIMFAGHAYVGESTQDPRKYFSNNVSDTIRFLDTLIDCGVRRVVFSSSCSVYGVPDHIPIKEESETRPLSPYGETKLFAEKVLKWYDSAYGLRSACLRYFNAAGADPEGELGEHHNPETHLIPLTIQAALGGDILKVFGTEYPTPDGTAIRDYIHVADLATGHLQALMSLIREDRSITVNLGTGSGYSVKQIIQAVELQSGLQVPVEYAARREGDAPMLIADAARARLTLGWSPEYSSLETIVRTALNWYRRSNAAHSPAT